MKLSALHKKVITLLLVIVPLLALFVYVGLRSGPLSPIAITIDKVEARALKPALFGIGTVEARYTYKIGPTTPGRLLSLNVHVGDTVFAGQVLGEMDPVDFDERLRSQNALVKRSQAALREAEARQVHAQVQLNRYQKLLSEGSTSEEIVTNKQLELNIINASLAAAKQDAERVSADREALTKQRINLRLIAPADAIVTLRNADPGSPIVAGQTLLELIDPSSLWINVRFDQNSTNGLAPQLPAHIVLRSGADTLLKGTVLRMEPKADPITEESRAKVIFESIPQPLPPLGELAEVTIDLPPLTAMATIPNAAIQRVDNQVGVWQIIDGKVHFTAVTLGTADLDGFVQVIEGLAVGDEIVVYSAKALTARSRIHIVDQLTSNKK